MIVNISVWKSGRIAKPENELTALPNKISPDLKPNDSTVRRRRRRRFFGITCERSESARERRIALYKSDQQQKHLGRERKKERKKYVILANF